MRMSMGNPNNKISNLMYMPFFCSFIQNKINEAGKTELFSANMGGHKNKKKCKNTSKEKELEKRKTKNRIR